MEFINDIDIEFITGLTYDEILKINDGSPDDVYQYYRRLVKIEKNEHG